MDNVIWGAWPLIFKRIEEEEVMSYQVIARKFRPQAFTELVGQDHITQTLANALKNGRIPHALLFTGPRGTGKTSSARILAKSLRCPHAVNFVPCQKCTSCLEISQSSSVDVAEIDGASNNGVDAIRELRDSVNYRPATGQYKIYIIDEVHMLSTSAFNALLKTLEEPPSHVIFIMATTEVHKIPATILSRCQRFDFRRISTRQISQALLDICQHENVSAESEALWLIARQGDGSMRDSLSLLDQVITFANGPLTKETVSKILGLTDRNLLYETLGSLLDRNSSAIIQVLLKVHQAGLEANLFAQELLEMIRHLLLVKVSGADMAQLIELPDSELSLLADLSRKATEEEIHLLFDMQLKGTQDVIRSHDPQLVLEMVLLRMASAPHLVNIKDLVKTPASSLAATTPARMAAAPASLSAKPSVSQKSPPVSELQASPTKEPLPTLSAKLPPSEKWLQFVERIRQSEALFAAKVENLLFHREEKGKIFLEIPARLAFLKEQMADHQNRTKFQNYLSQHWGPQMTFEVQIAKETSPGAESAQSMNLKKQQRVDEQLKENLADHPMIKAAQSVFKGQLKPTREKT